MKLSGSKVMWGGLAVAAVVVAGVALWPSLFPSAPEEPAAPAAEVKEKQPPRDKHILDVSKKPGAKKSPREAVRSALKGRPAKKRAKGGGIAFVKPDAIFAHLKGKDRQLAESVQKALDAEDFEKTMKAAEEAMQSDLAEVRQNAVEAMAWFGEDALPELTAAMADPDEDVSSAAENAWEQAVNDMESADTRLSVTLAAMSSLSNPDALASISGIMSGAANELIDGADDEAVAAKRRLEVVQSLVDIIENGPKACAEQAKEAYSDIVDVEWTGVEAAENHLYELYDYDAQQE